MKENEKIRIKAEKNRVTLELGYAKERELLRTDGKCEYCGGGEDLFRKLNLTFIDHDNQNLHPNNLAILCTPCENLFFRVNPNGLSKKNGIISWCINRNLYPPIRIYTVLATPR